MTQYTLYIASDKSDSSRFCVGSSLCMGTMEYIPDGLVNVVNCDDMKKSKKPFPTWLIGTPTLASYNDNNIYRGTQAVTQLQDFAISYTEHATTQRLTTRSQNPKTPQPPPASARIGGVVPPHPTEPPSNNDEYGNDRELSDLWESKIQDDESEEILGSRKLTGDDLSNAVAQRQQNMHNITQSGPPPPPPPQEKD